MTEPRFKRRNRRAYLPGEGSDRQTLDEMIRVDHAGEFGATRIYAGQLAVIGRDPRRKRTADLIGHMAAQEEVHKETFDRILNERRVRPTALAPVWHVAGFALGAATALMGDKAAMACTVAVESVIDEHYADQAETLGDRDPELKETIEKFRAEEMEHHDTALDEGAEEAPGYRLLSEAIKAGSRLAIKLSEKI